MRILLADANAEVLAALRLVLEQGAAQPREFLTVGEARDTTSLFAQVTGCLNRRCCPDVVLLDAGLPGLLPLGKPAARGAGARPALSLAELIQALRQLCPGLRVIALSSRPNAEKECLRAGADAFACKSDPPDALLALLSAGGYQ